MHFDILTTPTEIESIADDWRALHARCGGGISGSYAWHEIWWRHLGQSAGVTLHLVTARGPSGSPRGPLLGILPLIVRRKGFVRIAEWAGYEVFDYGDVLADTPDTVRVLWDFAEEHGFYDIALIKDIHAGAASLPVVSDAMQLRRRKKNYFLLLDFPSGEAWLAAQSRKLRGDTRRKSEKMEKQGAVVFHTYRTGDIVPAAVIDALYEQKKAWFAAHKKRGVFARPEVKGFLHELAEVAAKQGALYLGWLTCGDAITACHMGFVAGNILYLYHTTYDSAFGAYSPGTILMVETIKKAVDMRLYELDFMRGEENYKARFASGLRALSTYVAGRSWPGRLAVALQRKKPELLPDAPAADVTD